MRMHRFARLGEPAQSDGDARKAAIVDVITTVLDVRQNFKQKK